MTRFVKSWLGLAVATGSLALATGALAQSKELVFGLQCDRTGPTATVGVALCPGYHDHIGLVNSKGGIEGFKVRVIEVDNEYKVPPAIEAHERFKKEGAVSVLLYGTPHTMALTAKLTEDKIPGTSPGFGTAAGSANPIARAPAAMAAAPGSRILSMSPSLLIARLQYENGQTRK